MNAIVLASCCPTVHVSVVGTSSPAGVGSCGEALFMAKLTVSSPLAPWKSLTASDRMMRTSLATVCPAHTADDDGVAGSRESIDGRTRVPTGNITDRGAEKERASGPDNEQSKVREVWGMSGTVRRNDCG